MTHRDLAARVEGFLRRLEADAADAPTFGELAEVAAFERPETPLTMGEMVAFSGVGEHALRYYEREGLVRVPRDSAGRRRFDAAAVERIVLIARLRVSDMPVATLRRLARLLDAVEGGDEGADAELDAMLIEHRDRLRRRIAELQLAVAITEFKTAARRVGPAPYARSSGGSGQPRNAFGRGGA